MSTHNIQFCDKIRKFPIIFAVFFKAVEEFRRDSKTSSN